MDIINRYLHGGIALKNISIVNIKHIFGVGKPKIQGSLGRQFQIFSLAIPAVVLIFVFCYLPMIGIIIAFKDFKFAQGVFGSAWSGFRNFEFFFRSNDALRVIRNTLSYNIVFILLGMLLSVSFALFVAFIRKHFITRFYQSAMILPNLMSWVVVAYISLILLNYDNGMLNRVLQWFGKDAISWYSEPKYWPFIISISHFWKTTGYSCLVYYASIIAIDESLYEAARIDGATTGQCIRNITIPLISNTLAVLLILSVGNIFSGDFGLFYQMPQNSGHLVEVTDIINTYTFRTLMVTGNPGVAAAVGLMQSTMGFILVCLTNFIVKKIDSDNAMF